MEYGRFYQPMMAETGNSSCPVVIVMPEIGEIDVPDGLVLIPAEEAGRILKPNPVDFNRLQETLSGMNGPD
ncbi:hypothetical protein LAZ40_02340 [Cereibacter sphaeroides]|uniref:hypothetical protein n=1 Tax=Cereibacter sphaeroides TaxID=1063 RepID=UPI001F2D898E|nr:hypothetical protein [Cereibacter sphaeroides]MCE6957897.1 hypothetical protein [Cereibacter sphaeroides]MCE6971755.1 hypothetical protein [Cereibacter sphaeroides]